MKKTSYIYITAMATLIGCMATGCQNGLQDEYALMNGNGTEENGGSRTQLVEKSLTGIQAENLSTLLTDEEKTSVQKLVLQGELCGADILFIKTELPQLVELDMGNVNFKIMGTDSDYYCLDSDGNFYLKLSSEYILPAKMFDKQNGLKKIVLPNSIEEIGENAFMEFSNLEEVILPSRLRRIGRSAFQSCTALKSIEITPYVKEIAWNAFTFSGLESIVIPENVQIIRGYAFSENKNLTSVRIENSKGYIEGFVFSGCENLKEVVLDKELETIPEYTFIRCYNLENISLPDNLKSIGNGAFLGCGLLRVEIPQGVKVINLDAFYQCSSLKEVVFASKTIDQVGTGVFRDCSSLETINLPDMETIPESFFNGCTSLKNISIPQTVKTIGRYAFYNSGLEEINIGNNVKRLEDSCFGETKIRTLTVPESVTYAGSTLTEGCDELESIYWNSECDLNINNSNSNVFVFINSKNGSTPGWTTYAPKNMVIDGTAKQIVCNNTTENCRFRCPQEIQAENIKFTKYFSGWTYLGQSNNWYTICLPFKPTKIVTEDGRTLAPFGSSLETEDTKPFWLRTVTENGFVDAQEIEAYKPYIICMPYNTNEYLPEYNINGNVTFIGENITLDITPETLQPVAGPGYKFYPAMQYIPQSNDIYSLGDGNNSFTNVYNVRAFEAYIMKDSQNNDGTETVDVSRATIAGSRTAIMYEKKKGVPHISDMK